MMELAKAVIDMKAGIDQVLNNLPRLHYCLSRFSVSSWAVYHAPRGRDLLDPKSCFGPRDHDSADLLDHASSLSADLLDHACFGPRGHDSAGPRDRDPLDPC